MKADPKTTSGRAFVRSLNILLKFARLYGYEHARTIEQLQIAWQELRAAFPMGTEAGLLLGATNSQLLLDGVPLEGSPAEKQFAQLLSAAGLASIQFFASITEEEIGRFARAFPTGKAKPAELALQLKAALAGSQGIRINEICFVATDSRLKEASMAAQIAAASLGGEQDEFRKWLNDPQKLLELIAAAQGSKSGGVAGAGPGGPVPAGEPGEAGSAGIGSGAGGGSGSGVGLGYGGGTRGVGGGVGVSGGGTGRTAVPVGSFWASGGSGSVQVSDVVAGLAGAGGVAGALGGGGGPGRGGSGSGEPSEEEIYAILSALTSFGSVGAGQGGMAAAGVFQQQMAELPGRAQDMLKQALASLAAQAPNTKPDESVIVQLAEHLAIRFALERFERGEVKVNAVRQMLDHMNQEIENLRKILGAHEDKMSEAGLLAESHREILDRQFWAAVPESGKRAVLLSEEAWCIPPRNVQSYVGQLIEQGNVAEAVSILQNYASCAESAEADARKKTAVGLSEMAELYAKADPKLLSEALRHLGLRLSVEQDAELQGLVSAAFVRMSQEAATTHCFPAMQQALDLVAGMEFLPGRITDFPRASQDRMVRQISASGAPRRCHILLELLDHVDPLVMPLVIDEIGVTSDREALGKLLTIADGDLPTGGGPYLRVKAIEALGRINAPESVSTLRRIAESKKVFGWAHTQELRIAALQALEKLDPAWVRDFLPKSGIEREEYTLAPLDLPASSRFVRQRRHARVRLRRPVRAVSTNLKENFSLEIKTASLNGGIATISRHLAPGTQVQLKLSVGMRNLQATALMRDYRAQDMAFEFVDMNLEERGKYRRMLAGNLSPHSNLQDAADAELIAPARVANSR